MKLHTKLDVHFIINTLHLILQFKITTLNFRLKKRTILGAI